MSDADNENQNPQKEEVKNSVNEKKTDQQEAKELVNKLKENNPFYAKFQANWLEDTLSTLGEEYLSKNKDKIINFLNEESKKTLSPFERVRASVEGMKPDEYLAKKIDLKISKKFLNDKVRNSTRVAGVVKESKESKRKEGKTVDAWEMAMNNREKEEANKKKSS